MVFLQNLLNHPLLDTQILLLFKWWCKKYKHFPFKVSLEASISAELPVSKNCLENFPLMKYLVLNLEDNLKEKKRKQELETQEKIFW